MDFAWIGQVVQSGAAVYGTAKNGQISADTLNKQSEINDRTFAYNMATSEQTTKNTITILAVVGVIVVVGFIVITIFKRKAA